MKIFFPFLWNLLIASIFPVCLSANGIIPFHADDDSTSDYISSSAINSDPLTGKKYSIVVKVSTLQVLFSEAPFSVEIFLHSDMSMQLQAGIIFPLEKDHFLEQFFQSGGENASASSKGLISYRTSPYNSHGLSFKYELRKYFKEYYFAPQAMFKLSHYNEYSFDVIKDNVAVRQTESKHSAIGGVGLMLGRQTYFMKQATDWYIGAGLRARQIDATVLKEQYQKSPPGIIYPNSHEKKFSVYPFINFGFRTGLVF
ncbi:MAG TPA: hypothetical protein VK155_13995 [Bacteroidales bacterium]|jgi:hypothetical protein|nr:hypothetical protein [Bacteroidales bacterium]